MFFTPAGMERPKRLCDSTREFAKRSQDREFGIDTKRTPAVQLDGYEDFENLSPLEKYDAAIEKIVNEAPVRICEGELISGAATLGCAIDHLIPATYKGEAVFMGISHLTVDFESVLKIGIDGIKEKAKTYFELYRGTEREAFMKSCLHCIDCLDTLRQRYIKALSDIGGYEENIKALKNVPHRPARSFREAVQSIWFTFAYLRLCGNWPGIGRLDWLLGPYLKADLEKGAITIGEAREILAHLFIKGCEWICGDGSFGNGSGDAQHYQNILLAGVDEEGREVTNEVTYLVLDILEELGIGDFPTTVRVNKSTDEKLLLRVAEVMRYGGGILAVYNEDLVIDALVKYGYELKEARKFANDGCWEVQIPGKTYFSYIPIDSLRILQKATLGGYGGGVSFDSFDGLYSKFARDMASAVKEIVEEKKNAFLGVTEQGEWIWRPAIPCTLVSIFEKGCIEKGLSYLEGGPVYNIISPHIGGLADTVNSLYAIRRLVYEEKKMTLSELLSLLAGNWEGEEALRQYVLNKYTYYGNDSDDIDELYSRVLGDFADICLSHKDECGYGFPGGVSTFGRQIEWAPHRLASPHGRRVGDVLAPNCSPTPGTDREGATAIIRSYCKADLSKLTTGAALDIKLLPSSVKGDGGLAALVSLIRGFVSLGGFFMQPDVADVQTLKMAQQNPENYQTLAVRVSGWNARFVTLNKEWQDMVIAQNEK